MISVIIPAWNEEHSLARTISSVRNGRAAHEILVVDAGSSDNTSAVAHGLGAQLLTSPIRQRAAQLNLGGEQSKGEILLFLHADTILPPSALERIETRDGTQDGGLAVHPAVVVCRLVGLGEVFSDAPFELWIKTRVTGKPGPLVLHHA